MVKKLSFIFLICFLFSSTTQPSTTQPVIFSDRTKNVALAVLCLSAAIIPSYYACKHLGFLRNIAGYSGQTFSRLGLRALRRDVSKAASWLGRSWEHLNR